MTSKVAASTPTSQITILKKRRLGTTLTTSAAGANSNSNATSSLAGVGSNGVTSFWRKTAKGKVQKVLREHYLRPISQFPSLPSSSVSTAKAKKVWLVPDTNIILHQFDLLSSPQFPPSHLFGLLVPQTVLDEVRHRSLPLFNRLKAYLDEEDEELSPSSSSLIENSKTSVQGGEEVVNYRRFSKKGWIVWNEAIEELYVERNVGESINDRNDRAIRQVAIYYSQLLDRDESVLPSSNKRQKISSAATSSTTSTTTTSSSMAVDEAQHSDPVQVILLTDDRLHRDIANSESRQSGLRLLVQSTRDFVESLPESSTIDDDGGVISASNKDVLRDLLATSSDKIGAGTLGGGPNQAGRAIYSEYLPPSILQAGIKAGKLFSGHFNPNQYNYKEASVAVHGRRKPILLVGLHSMNRSVAGDIVVVELLPEREWKGANDLVVDSEAQAKNDDPEAEVEDDENDNSDLPKSKTSLEPSTPTRPLTNPEPTGRVVGILKRNWRTYVCHVDRSSLPPSALASANTSTPIFASPVSRSIPRIRIITRQALHLSSQKFLVSIDRWPVTSKYPEGHFVRVLGEVGSKEGELESLLEEFEVPYRAFSNSILSCLPEEGDKWVVPEKENDPKGVWSGREDFRDMIICSIDPPGCQDIDDALHARKLPNGNIGAGVHIADVSHFVHPDNPMDAEAASRGTTVYLVDKRIDMLPHLLGTNLCSLRPFVERLAFSVLWELTEEGDIVNVRFTKSVIASKEAFTYEAAQIRKDDKSLTDPLTEGIRLLNTVAINLRAKRMAAGALNLASPEVKIHMESAESSDPVDVEQKQLFETNSLVEEFMLLANISVAKRIYEQFPQTAVLRRHAPPPKTNFEVLQDVLMKRRGMNLDVSSSRALADSLDKCIDPTLPAFNTLVRIMATRCMLSAEYFCSGSIARDTFGHYGLASPIYTHFTSPIRRYADVMVHRQLSAAVSGLPLHSGLQTKSFVEKTLEVVNKRHRSAQQAARASIEFYVALAIQNREQLSVKLGSGKVRAEAFVIRTFRNGLAVFVSQFGLEGLVSFKRENEYDAETYEIAIPLSTLTPPSNKTQEEKEEGEEQGKDKEKREEVRLGVFDKVVVEISVEKDKNTQRGRVKMDLIEPVDSRTL